jgi:nicotinate-nucleotide adenylyltransferase
MAKTIILFGGSFDPIHVGHIEVAAAAMEKLCAGEMIFIPTKRSPHKHRVPSVCGEDRLKMISLAIEGNPLFSVNDCEITRAEPSYTLDTVKFFRDKFGADVEICFLIGADTIADLPKWHRIEELMRLCRFCTMYRGGMELPDLDQLRDAFSDKRIAQLQADIVETPLVDISSTEIRTTAAAGDSIEAMVSPKVAEYIEQNGLYR